MDPPTKPRLRTTPRTPSRKPGFRHRQPRPPRGPALRALLRGLHLLLPDPCLGCGTPLDGGEDFALCLPCRGTLRAHRPGCRRCGEPRPGGGVLPHGVVCDACRRRAPAFSAILSPWRYEAPLVAVVRALKFRGCSHLGARLARPLADWLRSAGLPPPHPGRSAAAACDVVVPVPLHPWRRWRRGYNQAERIAGPLARLLGLPCATLVARRRATHTQARLPRPARRRNVEGAFHVPRWRRSAVVGRRLMLVDDVCTTGATLEAAARALRRAGARSVLAVTVARTPLAGEPGGGGRSAPAPRP